MTVHYFFKRLSPLFFVFIYLSNIALAQDKSAYVIYNSKGKKVSYSKMLKSFKKTDVVLFGEYHDNPISHWLQLEVAKELASSYKLTMGAEMIEADNQNELNQYLSGEIDQKGFDTTARLWKNYKTDYKPLADLAKDSGLTFVATNIPRRYARIVSKGGFEALDTLSGLEKTWMAPLPIPFDPELPSYVRMLTMMGDHGSPDVVKAQAIKDATMAHFILKHVPARKRRSGKHTSIMLHFNGAYHSDFHEGIGWYLHQQNKRLKISTISTVSVSDPNKFEAEHRGKADFIICVDEDMTKTY